MHAFYSNSKQRLQIRCKFAQSSVSVLVPHCAGNCGCFTTFRRLHRLKAFGWMSLWKCKLIKRLQSCKAHDQFLVFKLRKCLRLLHVGFAVLHQSSTHQRFNVYHSSLHIATACFVLSPRSFSRNAMTDDIVLYSKKGGICTITLNRPERLNAISAALPFAIRDAINKVGDEFVASS